MKKESEIRLNEMAYFNQSMIDRKLSAVNPITLKKIIKLITKNVLKPISY